MARFEEAAGLLARLVAFDTTSRNSNLDIIRFAEAALAAHGIASRVTPDATGGKANLHAIIGPPVAGGVALSAHLDCVPVDGQAWLADPFILRRQEGRFVGRGACDMKGFAACMLAMAPHFATCGLKRPVHLCLTHDEETTFAGAARLAPELGAGAPPPAWCIIGEPSGMAPIVAHKGYASWDVTVTGLSGHSSRTTETANALHAAAGAVAWLAARAAEFAAHGRRAPGFEPPWSTVHVGFLHAGSVLNIVPDRADFAFEMRSVPGDSAAELLAALQAQFEQVLLPPLRAIHPGCEVRFSARADAPPLDIAEDHALTGMVRRLTGRNATGRVSYATEAGFFQRAGIASIVCGPGHIAQAHQPEEWLAESELAACLDFLHRLAGELAA